MPIFTRSSFNLGSVNFIMSIEDKLHELGITLPEAPAAVAAYQPWIRTGNLIFTSGQLPFLDGEIAYAGKLGAEISEKDL